MGDDAGVYEQARGRVVQFKEEFGIDWVRFKRLGDYDPALKGLDRKRWVLTLQGKTAPYGASRDRTIALGEAIARSRYELLEAMDVPVVRRRLSPKAASDPPGPLRIAPRGAEQHCEYARLLAGQAMHESGFTLLCGQFDHYADRCPSSALIVLETAVQFGYRYMTPEVFAAAMSGRELKIAEVAPKAEPALRLRCAAQVACALSEHGGSDVAGQFFCETENTGLLDPECQTFWYQPQLIRARAIQCWNETNRLAHSVRTLDSAHAWPSHGNRRSVAMLQAVAYAGWNKPALAWKCAEPFFGRDRQTLVESFEAGRPLDSDLGHVFHSVMTGSLARVIAGHRPRPGEMEQTLNALKWCFGQYGLIRQPIGLLVAAGGAKIGAFADLRQFAAGCTNQPYRPDFLRLLKNLFCVLLPAGR